MSTQKITIKNRHGLKLVIQVDTPDNPKDLVFIAHGQGGFIGQDHIEAFAQAFLENNFRVVRFDATHALGESEGDMMDVTYTGYIEDLEDVINWARTQPWFSQPFALCGASMGGTSTTWYAEHHPNEILAFLPMAPVVNYETRIKAMGPKTTDEWRAKGYKEEPSPSKSGAMKKVGWGVMEDLKKYNLLTAAENLNMPVLLMMGARDTTCPEEGAKLLFDRILSRNKKFVKIPGAEHSFRNAQTGEYGKELQEAKAALSSWLRSLNT